MLGARRAGAGSRRCSRGHAGMLGYARMRPGWLRRAGLAASASGLILTGCVAEDEPPTEPEVTQESTSELSVCMGDDVVQGIDVSYYQGDIDWTAVDALEVLMIVCSRRPLQSGEYE